ncbi:NAD-dependent epimerase/dehydratase family protein [Rhizobiales bacterium RZME27]|uniref:NAD-dependent epimerase/dehydratase family protein n=1 Tax=Endobacterium cereale TaxID=2663029 RepID=A0A6A8A3U3_9HYPH|nr:nucleoside-diphosphate sugar epimerase/dehydratase [Endobacterium cereale]MEB2845201.1 nucleoside-diphosphate sugar epimerase/dehydratase [Endobacterium cereale]MQY45982.1 NAD-dependent epimerase/dehydratase family protein [Endobacterium cereale]
MSVIEFLRRLITVTPRLWKRILLIGFDFSALMFALWASYALRYADWAPQITDERLLLGLLAPVIAIPVFIRMGLYRAVLRYLPDTAIWTILRAMAISTTIWVILVFLTAMAGRDIVPRSVPFFYFAIGVLLVGGSRFAAKLILSTGTGIRRDEHPMLIYGAGPSSVQLATVLRGHGKRYVVGLVDDDPQHHGRDVGGYRVFPPNQLPRLIEKYGIQEIILSMSSIPLNRRQAVISLVSGLGVKIRTLPDITDLVDGRYLVNQIREIEIDELLGRSFVPPDQNLLRNVLQNRVVMVTGAGGSIGSELCRLIAQWQPKSLVLFEANEFALYRIDRELRGGGHCDVVPVLASVRDAAQVRSAIVRNGVEVVYHAAAHKHVPLVEANVLEGISNNVFGTLTVADVALSAGVEKFVLISSDKAVRPTNVMGATKRWAELIIRDKAMEAAKHGGQHFCAVRFGNVLGSNGSVVPLFREQIANGGPVTVTDPDMTRYFMSIQEASELIVQASAMSTGGDTFLLDMGQPVRIGDLAENMIRLAGFNVRNQQNTLGSIEIQVTGTRPGEKLFEELFYDASNALNTQHPKIMRAQANHADRNIAKALGELQGSIINADEALARSILFDFIDIPLKPDSHAS